MNATDNPVRAVRGSTGPRTMTDWRKLAAVLAPVAASGYTLSQPSPTRGVDATDPAVMCNFWTL